MTHLEFARSLAWLSAAIGRPIDDDVARREARTEVYFECLGDLPHAAFQIACKRCALERKYQSFPPIAELRELATETIRGHVKEMTGAEAFGLAMKAMSRIDIEVKHTMSNYESLPPCVRKAVDAFGFHSLYSLPDNAIETARAQFTRLYDSMAERDYKTAILPMPVQRVIAGIGRPEEIFKVIDGETP